MRGAWRGSAGEEVEMGRWEGEGFWVRGGTEEARGFVGMKDEVGREEWDADGVRVVEVADDGMMVVALLFPGEGEGERGAE